MYRRIRTEVCIYCGDPAEVVDHVLPLSRRELGFKGYAYTVDACRECNALLSNSVQRTLRGRREEARKRLRKRYASLLRTPVWTPTELAQLGPALRAVVERDLAVARAVRKRVRFRVEGGI